MKDGIKGLLGSLTAFSLLATNKAAAQLGRESRSLGLNVADQDAGFATVLGSIINFFLGFVGLIAVVFLIYGGFLMITSAGDEGKVEKGTKIIIYSIAGIVVIVLSWVIVGTVINGLTGL